MSKLPHLKFVNKIQGKPRFKSIGSQSEKTKKNKKHRKPHSSYLNKRLVSAKNDWSIDFEKREEKNLAPLDKELIPVFLQINPHLLSEISFDLQKFGIEIISEEEEGYIVGASFDGLKALEKKIEGFVEKEHGTAKIADLWEIKDGNRRDWKPKHILSEKLYSEWSNINEHQTYKVEVGIAFDKPLGKEPDPTKQGGQKRLQEYRKQQILRDESQMKRETHFDDFIDVYGERTSSFVDLEDSFSCEIEISGIGLKDLVVNYPFVFEVNEIDEIYGKVGNELEISEEEIEILPPKSNAVEVGVIDSGIMEGHKYLQGAINVKNSKSYVHNDNSTADKVMGGGHGTKVAGAILYPLGLTSLESPYQIPYVVRNLRVLDENCSLKKRFPPDLMNSIVDDNEDCDLFNMSINTKSPFRTKHMSSWAATLDTLIHNKNKVFVISTGNIDKPTIRDYINRGLNYPNYMNQANSRIANPGQSSFSIVVGSVNHSTFENENWVSLGKKNDVSAFSRAGNGIWGMIKPDVVEFGGGLVKSKNSINSIRENNETSTELIRSTLDGGSAYCKGSTGTSFSAPKVSNIVAKLKELYPKENNNLIRALVAQGARLPKDHFLNPTTNSIKYFGYGIPSLYRVTENTEQRVTYYNTSRICAEEGDIYSLKIPESLLNQANEHDILIEVTLSFTAEVRRTRQKTKSYLSTWLSWMSSNPDEPLNEFRKRSLKVIEGKEIKYEKDDNNKVIKWKIRENSAWGSVKDFNRNNSSLQKDWVIIKSYELDEEISFCVQGHKGWDVDKKEIPYAFTVSIEALNADIPIYEEIKVENETEVEL